MKGISVYSGKFRATIRTVILNAKEFKKVKDMVDNSTEQNGPEVTSALLKFLCKKYIKRYLTRGSREKIIEVLNDSAVFLVQQEFTLKSLVVIVNNKAGRISPVEVPKTPLKSPYSDPESMEKK